MGTWLEASATGLVRKQGPVHVCGALLVASSTCRAWARDKCLRWPQMSSLWAYGQLLYLSDTHFLSGVSAFQQ
jgi:hypothetical protein